MEADRDTLGDGSHGSTGYGPRSIVATSTRMHSKIYECVRVMIRASITVLRDGFPSRMSPILVSRLRVDCALTLAWHSNDEATPTLPPSVPRWLTGVPSKPEPSIVVEPDRARVVGEVGEMVMVPGAGTG